MNRKHVLRIAKRGGAIVLLAAAGGLVVYAFRPRPVEVETAIARRGPLQVTIDEDGKTRAHDRFTLAAPVSGILSRIELHEGDRVARDAVIATVRPLPVDSREEAEIRARIASLEALEREAVQQAGRVNTSHQQALRDLARAQTLAGHGDIPRERAEEAQSKATALAQELEAARQRVTSAGAEVARAKAGLLSLAGQRGDARAALVRAPIECRVLRILEASERAVAAGTPLLTLSNPAKIEIVADLLSTDAVKVKPGAPVTVLNWGGPGTLRARVRNVEPFGFTKVSALGIEEQRVNVIADFLDPPTGLGDGYSLDVSITIWESSDVLKVPASALFRSGEGWGAFVASGGFAHARQVEVGRRNALEAEVTKGIAPGEHVLVHPSNDIREGLRIAANRTATR
ncbi:MAG: efflux RND transporter periplasmic adaptor subunit [Bryobacteraceae bacterium]